MELLMTCGPQGSGKSTWAKKFAVENPDILYLSTDTLRKKIGAGEHDQTVNGRIFAMMRSETDGALRNGQSVLLDGTFIKKAWRKDFTEIGRKHGARLVAHVFNANRDTLIKRVKQRAAQGGLDVPDEAIDRYIAMFQLPTIPEFDEIINH